MARPTQRGIPWLRPLPQPPEPGPPTPLPPVPIPPVVKTVVVSKVVPKKTPRVYVTSQGDLWDMISLRVYGMRRWDDHYMHKLIEANYPLRNLSVFPAGVGVIVPDIPVRVDIPLVPWKKATLISTP